MKDFAKEKITCFVWLLTTCSNFKDQIDSKSKLEESKCILPKSK